MAAGGRGEMAYAAGLGPVGGDTVGVRIPPPALKVVQDGRQANGEHLPADRAEQFGHDEPARTGEAGVVEGEAGTVVVRLDVVADVSGRAALLADPGEPEQRRLADLEDLAVDDAAPAGHRLAHELEPGADYGGEADRPAASPGRGPPRDQVRVSDRAPDLGRGMRVIVHDVDVSHGSSRADGSAEPTRFL